MELNGQEACEPNTRSQVPWSSAYPCAPLEHTPEVSVGGVMREQVSFGKKTDPEGKYIRHYLPVLKDMPKKYIYEPWKAPLDVQRKVSVLELDMAWRVYA
jgi:hypothetical protein